MISILALDLGSTMGWAVRDRGGAIVSGFQKFTANRYEGGGMRFVRMLRWLDDILEVGIDQVYFEEVRRHLGVNAAHIYGGFMANLTSRCESANPKIPYSGVPVGTIKKFMTGKGNASKEDMISAVCKRGFVVSNDNEADALGLLFYAISLGHDKCGQA